jgi:hypothetical protein
MARTVSIPASSSGETSRLAPPTLTRTRQADASIWGTVSVNHWVIGIAAGASEPS